MSTGMPLYRLPSDSRNNAAGIALGAASAVAVGIVLGMWVATQYVAVQLHFHPSLGRPLLTVPPPLRMWLAPAAAAALGAAGLTRGWSRRWAGWLFLAAGLLLALRIGPLYPPLNFLFWGWRFGNARGTAAIWTTGLWIVTIPSALAVVVWIIVPARRARETGARAGTHGS